MKNFQKHSVFIYRLFPFIHWLKGYGGADFREDLVAGLTVAVVLIPQSMAYAMVAGLPPVYGLYAAAVTPFVAALYGSLRQLGTGPIAIMSLLVLTTLTPLAEPGSRQFIELAFLLAFLVGVFYLTIGIVVFELHDTSVAIVGETSSGLPRFHTPIFELETVSSLIGPAIVIALVSFAETYSVGKAISAVTKQKVDVNQEFIGQGLANIVGSFFQSYPVSGSFSRTAIAYAAGARTGMCSVVASAAVVVALLFLTPVLAYIPKTALAAMVISAVLTLFHPKEVFNLWKKNRHDGAVAITVFVLALVSKPDYALLIGIGLSMMLFLWKTMHPRIVRETRDPELEMFVNADLFGKPSCPQILQLRSDNSIYFANAEYTIEHMLERIDAHRGRLKYLVLDLQVMGFIDLTGVDELRELLEEVRSRGADLALTDVHLPVKQALKQAGFMNEMNPDLLVENRRIAISRLFQHLDHNYCKNICPHALFVECPTVK